MNVPVVVIDTNVILSALKSINGQSNRLLQKINTGVFDFALSVPLVLEYESVLKGYLDKADYSDEVIDDFLDYLCRVGKHIELFYLWRPYLKDPYDDHVLEVAIQSGSEFIITYNKKDFKEKNTTLLYDNNSILKKALTLLDEDIDEFIIDNEDSFNKIKNTLEENKKNYLLKKFKKYFKDEDIFSYYKIDVQIERALDRKVYLESGASIVIEKTEALVSIDVNTGQNTGNQSSQNLIFNTNLEACKEIARQIKLRNLAGIIIIDFIDLKKNSDRKKILEELKRYLKKDRMEINSLDFSHLGLVQFTRKRQGKELSFYYREKCHYCEGTSYMLSKDRIILSLLADLNSQIKYNDLDKIVVKTKKDIIKEIKKLISNPKIEFVEDSRFYKEGYKIELYRR